MQNYAYKRIWDREGLIIDCMVYGWSIGTYPYFPVCTKSMIYYNF